MIYKKWLQLFIIIGCNSSTMDHINGQHHESNHDGYIFNEDEIHSSIHDGHVSLIIDECFSILHNGWHPSMHEFHSSMMYRYQLPIHRGHERISYEYMYPSIQYVHMIVHFSYGICFGIDACHPKWGQPSMNSTILLWPTVWGALYESALWKTTPLVSSQFDACCFPRFNPKLQTQV
jgi:hypothetical protein